MGGMTMPTVHQGLILVVDGPRHVWCPIHRDRSNACTMVRHVHLPSSPTVSQECHHMVALHPSLPTHAIMVILPWDEAKCADSMPLRQIPSSECISSFHRMRSTCIPPRTCIEGRASNESCPLVHVLPVDRREIKCHRKRGHHPSIHPSLEEMDWTSARRKRCLRGGRRPRIELIMDVVHHESSIVPWWDEILPLLFPSFHEQDVTNPSPPHSRRKNWIKRRTR